MLIKVAISTLIDYKPAKGDEETYRKLNGSYHNVEITQMDWADHINRGHVFAPWHKNHWRHEDNFVCLQYIALDFDDAPDVDAILSNPIVSKYNGIFYHTASSKPEAPRIRLIFVLEYPIYDPVQARETVQAFIWKLGAGVDAQCHDPCRQFMGSKGSEPTFTDRTIPMGVVATVLKEWRVVMEAERKEREAERQRRRAEKLSQRGGAGAGRATQQQLDEAGEAANGFLKRCRDLSWSGYEQWLATAVWAVSLDDAFQNNSPSYFYDQFCDASRRHPEYQSSDEQKLQRDFTRLKPKDLAFSSLWLKYDEKTKQAVDPSAVAPAPGSTSSAPAATKANGNVTNWTTAPGIINNQQHQAQEPAVKPPRKPKSGKELMAKEFAPLRWIVPGVLPEGLSMLSAKPKIGKSWFALNISIAVAYGGIALDNIRVEKGDVLYLALEDNERRLQNRIRKLCPEGLPEDDSWKYETEWGWGMEACGGIENWLIEHPNARLVVVDTLEKVRTPRTSNDGIYSHEYNSTQGLKMLSDKYRVAILVIHHNRKGQSDDPLEDVSGSTGLSAGIDNLLVLRRTRGESSATLSVIGRDTEGDGDLALEFEKETAQWRYIGQSKEQIVSSERQEILDLLIDFPDGLKPEAIAAKLRKREGTVRQFLRTMLAAKQVKQDEPRGRYMLPDQGDGEDEDEDGYEEEGENGPTLFTRPAATQSHEVSEVIYNGQKPNGHNLTPINDSMTHDFMTSQPASSPEPGPAQATATKPRVKLTYADFVSRLHDCTEFGQIQQLKGEAFEQLPGSQYAAFEREARQKTNIVVFPTTTTTT